MSFYEKLLTESLNLYNNREEGSFVRYLDKESYQSFGLPLRFSKNPSS
jgi:hypothetical protein